MRFKLDENLSGVLKVRIAELGHDVCTAGDEGLLSEPDDVIAQAAKLEGRILLTLDVDFGNIGRYPPGSHPGIFLFRPARFGPLAVINFIEQFVQTAKLSDLLGCLTIVEPSRIRVRRPNEFDSKDFDDRQPRNAEGS